MGHWRRLLLSALPKVLLSRATGVAAHVPIPRALRPMLYGAFARRYGADLAEIDGVCSDYRTFAAFFQRPLRAGARAVADSGLVWPADGRLIACGPIADGRMPQVKGIDYGLAELLGDPDLANTLADGSQATIYLAPGDYHRVHAPFAGQVLNACHIRGGLFPVNTGAVGSVPRLFARNERLVLHCRLADGRAAAVVLVAALNVSDTMITCGVPGPIARGQEIGRFGLGSTVITVIAAGQPSLPLRRGESVVRTGANALV